MGKVKTVASAKPKKAQSGFLGKLFGSKDCTGPNCGKPRSADRKAARQAMKSVKNPRFKDGGKKAK